jgi:hypothetical protein
MAATFVPTGGMLRRVYCVVSSICLVSRSARAVEGGSDPYPCYQLPRCMLRALQCCIAAKPRRKIIFERSCRRHSG